MSENDRLEELLTRGVANIIPSKIDLKKELSKRKFNIYLGIDPTSPKIHLGHTVLLLKLQEFAKLGHNVTLIIGDFTALVGDTSDKESERPILTEKEIENNFNTYKNQAEKILDFSKIKVKNNSEWLSKLTYAEVFKLKQQFSLNDFISRELIKKRLAQGDHIRLDETEYPIMQGYDSYFLDTDLQIGGTDQTFNMQAGRILQKKLRNKDSFILATEFLMGTDGRKMSKSWGNAIWLNDEPSVIYKKILQIEDSLIIKYFTLATNVSLKIITDFEYRLKRGENPISIKEELARLIVEKLYDSQAALKAEEEYRNAIAKREPENISTFVPPKNMISGATVSQIITASGISPSMSETKRLILQGGTAINNEIVTNPSQPFEFTQNSMTARVGKKFIKIKKP